MRKKSPYPVMITLQAMRVVIVNMKKFIADFAKRRHSFTSEYADQTLGRVDAVTEELSKDKYLQQKEATSDVLGKETQAMDMLTDFSADLKVAYRKDKARLDYVRQTLGFSKYYEEAKNMDQEALSALLFCFGQNVEPLRTELTEKEIPAENIDAIKNLAKSFSDADVTQESEKGGVAQLTDVQTILFNDLYDDVMNICIMGQSIFKKDAAKKKMFSFSAIVEEMAPKKSVTDESDSEAPATPQA